MRHIIRIVALAAVVVLSLNVAIAEQIVYSERCLKTRQAEHAIQEKYQIVPEIYTFFVRNIPKLEHDGQYLVIVNAETGVVEDVVYDALLPGAG